MAQVIEGQFKRVRGRGKKNLGAAPFITSEVSQPDGTFLITFSDGSTLISSTQVDQGAYNSATQGSTGSQLFEALNPDVVQTEDVAITGSNNPNASAGNPFAVNPAASLPQLPQGVINAANTLQSFFSNFPSWALIGGLLILVLLVEK